MPDILVTNDDGVKAPGIQALADAMKTLGNVRVVAPATNQSSSGHKKTLYTDIPFAASTLQDETTAAIAISGSPADCIALTALGIGGEGVWPPRLVVSGINRGANMGQDITYSGTVTAALEAVINGVPAVAFSLANYFADDVSDYHVAAQVAVQVVKIVLEKAHTLPPFTILNVNIPNVVTLDEIKGMRLTRQGIRIYRDALEQDGDVYRIVGDPPTGRLDEPGTDLWAVEQGYVSITPLHLDLTAHHFMADLAAWDLGLS